jgi:hypothetical protein
MGALFLIVLTEWKLALGETRANIVREIQSGNNTAGTTLSHRY